MFVLQRTWKYSVFEVHDLEWEEPEVGTTGSVGAVLISKVISMENKKINDHTNNQRCFTGGIDCGCYA